jgi:hypothetical protein
MPLATKFYIREKVTDLLVRYWGLGEELGVEEKETLLKALDEENKFIGGPLHLRALEKLRDKGIS